MTNQAKCKLTTHGAHQLELALKYPVQDETVLESYDLDVYFYTPYHLDVNEHSYPAKNFFKDIKTYIRMVPASLTFSNLASTDCKCSPIARIIEIMDNTQIGRKLPTEKILYELRMLVNMHHEEFKGLRQILKNQFTIASPDNVIGKQIEQICKSHTTFISSFRKLHILFTDTRIPENLRTALHWADEIISVKTDREFHKLRILCEQRPGLSDTCSQLLDKSKTEQKYRSQHDYITVSKADSQITGETFLYRESMLKKWAQGATYLSVARSSPEDKIGHIFAGIAAALAMIFAVATMFIAQHLFDIYSLPWILLIVISYMCKDRIKEVVRGILIKWQPKLIADDILALVHPLTHKKLGKSRSRIRFIATNTVPEFVSRLRDSTSNPFRSILPPESVMHFHNSLNLHNKNLISCHSRLNSIEAIFRLRINQWLKQMDDPANKIHYMDGEEPATTEANRVYHINIVIRFSCINNEEKAHISHARVIMNSNGIVRIEQNEA